MPGTAWCYRSNLCCWDVPILRIPAYFLWWFKMSSYNILWTHPWDEQMTGFIRNLEIRGWPIFISRNVQNLFKNNFWYYYCVPYLVMAKKWFKIKIYVLNIIISWNVQNQFKNITFDILIILVTESNVKLYRRTSKGWWLSTNDNL